MRLRPAETHWFETYVPRRETVYALEALASTGVVQLELDSRLTNPLNPDAVGRFLEQCQQLRTRYREWLPAALSSHEGQVESPEVTARKAVACLESWGDPIDGLLERQAQLEAERQNLLLLRECIAAMRSATVDTAHLSRPGQFLYKGVFACPQTRDMPENVCAVIDEFIPGREHNFFVVADEPACQDIIEHAYRSGACLSLQIPEWLPEDSHEQNVRIAARLAEIGTQAVQAHQALDAKKHDAAVAAALGDIDRLVWYMEHSEHLASTSRLCHVTGWTTAETAGELQQAFVDAGIHGAIRFARPPGFSRPPVYLGLPWWARPFVFIPEMMGTPDSTEVDSSKLLAVVVPLLFGYMFPDVGHGLMLALFSILLYRRWPAGRFLVPCGVSAMLFGVVFGEVFGIEGVLEPLWISPLEHPLEILFTPLLLGVALILIGLVFGGIEALWRGEARAWLLRDAAVMVMYAAAIVAVFVPAALWVALLALAWFVAGQLLGVASGRLANLGRNLALLLESSFELALNTLSFLRVGAFALAHAGLSAAIVGLLAGITNDVLHLLLMAAGHVFIVVIEGLVVFVQTTRLVLFEFFTQFLRAEGRLFRPMVEPPHGAGSRHSESSR